MVSVEGSELDQMMLLFPFHSNYQKGEKPTYVVGVVSGPAVTRHPNNSTLQPVQWSPATATAPPAVSAACSRMLINSSCVRVILNSGNLNFRQWKSPWAPSHPRNGWLSLASMNIVGATVICLQLFQRSKST